MTPPPPSPSPADETGGHTVRDRLGIDGDVAEFLDGVRLEYRRDVPNEVAARHLRAMLVASSEHPAPDGRWRRRIRRASAIGAAKIALTAGVAAAATGGGLAATGNLPDQVQRVVADAAAQVGVTVPAPRTPGDPDEGRGVGDGGVPAPEHSGTDEAVPPGRSGDAPGQQRDAEGTPGRPDHAGTGERPAGSGTDRSGERPRNQDRTGGERADEAGGRGTERGNRPDGDRPGAGAADDAGGPPGQSDDTAPARSGTAAGGR